MRNAHDLLGEGLAQRGIDAVYDRADICQDLIGPKANDAKIISRQPSSAPLVTSDLCCFSMLAAIYFYD